MFNSVVVLSRTEFSSEVDFQNSELLQDCKANNRSMEEGNKHVWTEVCDEAFQTLRKMLTTSLVLAQPDIAKSFDA
jgi:hypothetical protein